MKTLKSTATTQSDAARRRALPPSAALFAIFLAAIGCCTAMPASADDEKRPTEVTITVVEDPEQLKEKINKIQLPDLHAEAHPVQKAGKQPTPEKSPSTTGGQQHNDTTEHHPRDPATAPHHDTADKPIHPGRLKEEIHHGETKLPR